MPEPRNPEGKTILNAGDLARGDMLACYSTRLGYVEWHRILRIVPFAHIATDYPDSVLVHLDNGCENLLLDPRELVNARRPG